MDKHSGLGPLEGEVNFEFKELETTEVSKITDISKILIHRVLTQFMEEVEESLSREQ